MTHPSGQVGFSILKGSRDPPVIPQLAKFLFGVGARIIVSNVGWDPNDSEEGIVYIYIYM